MLRRVSISVFVSMLLVLAAGQCARAEDKTGNPPAFDQGKGVLDIIVVDQEGNRLSGATVAVPGYRSTTGLNGTARFGLLPGRYSVLVSKAKFRGRRINAGVRPGETTTLRAVLQKLPTPIPKKK